MLVDFLAAREKITFNHDTFYEILNRRIYCAAVQYFTDDTRLLVIFLTGVTDRQKISKALKMGPKGYLLKPIDINRLLKLIAECIG